MAVGITVRLTTEIYLFLSFSEYIWTCRFSVKRLYYSVAVNIFTRIWRQQWWAEA